MSCLRQKMCGDSQCPVGAPQFLRAFPINRQRPDGRHLYCKVCSLRRVNENRQRQRARFAKTKPAPVVSQPPSREEKVWKAISDGHARTQAQIKRLSGVSTDELGDILAALIIDRGWVKTDLVREDTQECVRVYFPNPVRHLRKVGAHV
jgi:hypothetical protein